jgi:hypothetical protein
VEGKVSQSNGADIAGDEPAKLGDGETGPSGERFPWAGIQDKQAHGLDLDQAVFHRDVPAAGQEWRDGPP